MCLNSRYRTRFAPPGAATIGVFLVSACAPDATVETTARALASSATVVSLQDANHAYATSVAGTDAAGRGATERRNHARRWIGRRAAGPDSLAGRRRRQPGRNRQRSLFRGGWSTTRTPTKSRRNTRYWSPPRRQPWTPASATSGTAAWWPAGCRITSSTRGRRWRATQEYYWKVRTWDKTSTASPYSAHRDVLWSACSPTPTGPARTGSSATQPSQMTSPITERL